MSEDSIIDSGSALSFDNLRKLHDTYEAKHDRQGIARVKAAYQRKGAMQTPDMQNSGVLVAHKVQLDTSGLNMRPAIAYTGDNSVWMREFMSPGVSGRIDTGLFTGKNSESGKALAERRRKALEAAGL